MAEIISYNGIPYIIPDVGDENWGQNVTDFLVAIPQGCLQKVGGSFTLLSDVDFGASFGLISTYYKSRSSNPASAGVVRLANTDAVAWRNFANSGNNILTVNSTDQLVYNGSPLEFNALTNGHIFVGNASNIATDVAVTGDIGITNAGLTAIQSGVITNSQVNASAAIAYSKLNLTGMIVNNDIGSSASISYSKLNLAGSVKLTSDVTGILPVINGGTGRSTTLEGPLNVITFGADPTGSADSTTAIQNALNTAATTGQVVYLPAGRYKITDTLQVNWGYSGSYPNSYPQSVGVIGDGSGETFIEWWGTQTLQTVRKAMMYVNGGFGRLENFTLLSPRAGLGTAHTPYYGIVAANTFWKTNISHISISYVHVPLSIGVIKTSKVGTNGLEFEPTSGGTALNIDAAQFLVSNCRFTAYTYEFIDGTLNALTQNNANGTNLLKGQATTTALNSAAFSDGSYAVEIGTPQAVDITFNTCTIEQLNVGSGSHVSSATSTVRLNQAGQILFDNCLFFAPPSNNTNYTYSLFENVSSGGSNIYLQGCYFIGGIFYGSSSNGILKIKNCNGESFSADNVEFNSTVSLIAPLGSALGHFLDIDGLDTGRSDASGGLMVTIDTTTQLTTSPGLPFGNNIVTTGLPRYQIRNTTGVGPFVIGGFSFPDPSCLQPQTSLFPDLPGILRGKAITVDFLPPAIYTPASARANMSVYSQHDGKWMYKLTQNASNGLEPRVPISVDRAYNFSVDTYVKMQSGHTPSEINGDCQVYVSWYDSSGSLVVGQTPTLLGNTLNIGSIQDGIVQTFVLNNVVPPSTAAFVSFLIGGTPVSTRVAEVSIGNLRCWVAGNPNCASLIFPATSFVASSIPTVGTWAVGDFVRNSVPSTGATEGWVCTAAGTPGTWVVTTPVVNSTTIPVANGGTGQTSYTNGQLLIGNTTGNTLTKATLTGTANQVVVTNSTGSITLSTPQSINTTSTPSFTGLTLTSNLTFTPTTVGIVGTGTNDSAATGNVGQYIESVISTNTNVPTSLQYGDLTSISLTAGDWDVSLLGILVANGATITGDGEFGVSTTSGNSSTGLVFGDTATAVYVSVTVPQISATIPPKRFSLSTTTTLYLKYRATYSTGTPVAIGRLSARRMRQYGYSFNN